MYDENICYRVAVQLCGMSDIKIKDLSVYLSILFTFMLILFCATRTKQGHRQTSRCQSQLIIRSYCMNRQNVSVNLSNLSTKLIAIIIKALQLCSWYFSPVSTITITVCNSLWWTNIVLSTIYYLLEGEDFHDFSILN